MTRQSNEENRDKDQEGDWCICYLVGCEADQFGRNSPTFRGASHAESKRVDRAERVPPSYPVTPVTVRRSLLTRDVQATAAPDLPTERGGSNSLSFRQ